MAAKTSHSRDCRAASSRSADWFTLIMRLIAQSARGVWQIVKAIKHRSVLKHLSHRDDRMLADVGLTRSDLYDAGSEPFWRDPTTRLKQLKQRVSHDDCKC